MECKTNNKPNGRQHVCVCVLARVWLVNGRMVHDDDLEALPLFNWLSRITPSPFFPISLSHFTYFSSSFSRSQIRSFSQIPHHLKSINNFYSKWIAFISQAHLLRVSFSLSLFFFHCSLSTNWVQPNLLCVVSCTIWVCVFFSFHKNTHTTLFTSASTFTYAFQS